MADEDNITLVGASYWAENPDELAEALKELTGVDRRPSLCGSTGGTRSSESPGFPSTCSAT